MEILESVSRKAPRETFGFVGFFSTGASTGFSSGLGTSTLGVSTFGGSGFGTSGLGASGLGTAGSLGFGAGGGVGKLTSRMAFFGQTVTHLRQRRHFVKSMYAKLFSTVMAPNGHSFSHLPQPIQLTAQAFIAAGPLSLLTQETYTLLPLGPFLRSSMIPRGQAFTQAPQEVHFSSLTSGIPVSGLTLMASN